MISVPNYTGLLYVLWSLRQVRELRGWESDAMRVWPRGCVTV